jgi:hypothetical protein
MPGCLDRVLGPARESRSLIRRRGSRTMCRLARDCCRLLYRVLPVVHRRESLHCVLLVGRTASMLGGCCCSARRWNCLVVCWCLEMARLYHGRRDCLLFRAVEVSTLTPCCGCDTVMRWWLGICAEMPYRRKRENQRGSLYTAKHCTALHAQKISRA